MRRGTLLLNATLLGAALVGVACGGGGGSAGGSASGGGPKVNAGSPARGSANVILEEEIAASGATNALEAIQRLRPAMLRGRGQTTLEPSAGGPIAIMLRVDDVPVGTIDQATNIGALTVKEIRFINASDATTRFGTGYPMGAVLITTKRK
ncbi:MAG TPA: hypothetical protein VFV33_21435 [Gemmatimonadaceae bacterium]|nr:hypothetical protein [Gemmatimonadaceae bacterium]